MQTPSPPRSEAGSTWLGLGALLLALPLVPLEVAALFWSAGVAGRAFHWMCGGF